MWEEIKACLEQSELEKALSLALQVPERKKDDEYYILEASIWEQAGGTEQMFSSIQKGLYKNPANYELFIILGQYYYAHNKKQAYLCMRQAESYCKDKTDLAVIQDMMQQMFHAEDKVPEISIVIVSYNAKEYLKNCLDSIRKNIPETTYELIVVDNASTDGVREWLEEQQDVKLIKNSENKGFGYACNQGAEAAKKGNDVYLLNNDTWVPKNAIWALQMGLYEKAEVGMTGSMTNYAGNGQLEAPDIASEDVAKEYAARLNVPSLHPYEYKIMLGGFSLLIKRKVWNQTKGFDLAYGRGYFEDDDLGMRVLKMGYKIVLCHNSFIVHYGSVSFRKEEDTISLMVKNEKLFEKKWGIVKDYYTYVRQPIIDMMTHSEAADIKVLEVGCGVGMTLSHIKYLYPNALVYGIELNETAAEIGGNIVNVRSGNIETMTLDFKEETFDYIIFADVLEHLHDPEEILKKMRKYLTKDGCILASIPNLMHGDVVTELLKGNFSYQDSGILDRTHLRFFTRKEIIKMFDRCRYSIRYLGGIRVEPAKNLEMLNQLYQLPDVAGSEEFSTYQYMVRAKRNE